MVRLDKDVRKECSAVSTVTAGDEVHVIPGEHRPAIIDSINPVGELPQTGVGDGRTHVCARGLAPKESEREQGSRLGRTRQTASERLRPQDQTWRSLTVVHHHPHSRLSDLDANYASYA